jgi:hypothetical protein
MKRGFVEELEQSVKRPLSDAEIAATGALVLSGRLPDDRRKRKRRYRQALEEARISEIGLKAKKT